MKDILCYTRKPIDEFYYDPKLAYSMHLALREEGKFHALNHNSGVLFAKATENEDGSLNAKSIRNPYLFVMRDGTYGVLAVRVDGDGGEDVESTGKAIFFTSHDLLEYKEEGLLPLCEGAVDRVVCSYDPGKEMYEISWCQSDKQWYRAELKHIECMDKRITGVKVDELILPAVETEIEGAVAGNVISIPDETAKRLQQKLLPPRHIKTEVPEEVQAASREQLELVWARALYSDGTEALKRVDWNMDSIDWSRPGVYEVEGKLHQDHFPFPMAEDRADPCITYWNGKYYFIATNDADKNHTLYVREADTIPGLVEAKEHLILDSDTYDYVGNLLWAPEFHEIKGELYIFLALTPEEFFGEESHIMKLKEGGNPSRKEDWSEPKRVVRSDGSQLCEAGKTITLDMTCFFWEGDYYVVWSQRPFLP